MLIGISGSYILALGALAAGCGSLLSGIAALHTAYKNGKEEAAVDEDTQSSPSTGGT